MRIHEVAHQTWLTAMGIWSKKRETENIMQEPHAALMKAAAPVVIRQSGKTCRKITSLMCYYKVVRTRDYLLQKAPRASMVGLVRLFPGCGRTD